MHPLNDTSSQADQPPPTTQQIAQFDEMIGTHRIIGISLLCASSIVGANPSLYDSCLAELSIIPRESVDRDTYLEMVNRLSKHGTEPPLQAEKLSRRAKAIFNMWACADKRPCTIDPTIPSRTVEDRQNLCRDIESALHELLIPNDNIFNRHTRRAV